MPKFSWLLVLCSSSVLASQIGSFDVHISSRSKFDDTFLNHFSGWECSSSSSLSYQELLPNHRGEKAYTNRETKGKSGRSLFRDPEIYMSLRKDMNEKSQIVAKNDGKLSSYCLQLHDKDR